MNVGLVSQEYPPDTAVGGIGSQTWNKARTLARLGHRVHVLSCGQDVQEECRTSSHDGVTVHRMRPPHTETNGCYNPPTYWLGYSWHVLKHLRRLSAALSFDIIDFPEYAAEGFAYQLDRTAENGSPVAVQLHGPLSMFGTRIGWPPTDSDLFRVGTSMEDYCIKAADALMACSANIADFTAEYHGVPRERIEVVHCGVDAEMFRPPQVSPSLAKPVVLFAGTLAASKGLSTVLEAVFRLRRKFPEITLHIAGKRNASAEQDILHRARQAGAESNIQLKGFLGREEMAEAYRQAAVFCSPATHEPGVANVYIEAMACGCPVVACNTGGAPEAVTEGVTGFLLARQDAEATAAAIDRVLSNPALRHQMSRNSRRRVEQYFAMDRYIARILAVYERAMGSAQAAAAGRLTA